MKNLSYAHVFMSNPKNSYYTDLARDVTLTTVSNYFIGQTMEIGSDTNLDICVGLHFYSAKNDTDHFVGKVSKENLDKFRLNACYALVRQRES